MFLKHKVRSAGAPAARDRASRRRPPSPTRRTARATRRGRLPLRVDAARRLVEDQDVRLSDRNGGEGKPLALAAREIARMPRRRPAEPDPVECGASPLFIPVDGQRDLLQRRLLDEITAGILRQIAGAPTHLDRARLRLEQPRGDPRERRLAGAVRPLEDDDLAAADVEVDALEHRHRLPVGERDAREAQSATSPEELVFQKHKRSPSAGAPPPATRAPPVARRRGRSGPRRRRPPASRARARGRPGAPRARPSPPAARPLRGRARQRPGRAGRSARRAAAAAARARAPRRGRPAAARRRRARSSSGPRDAARRRLRARARRAARSRQAASPRFSSPNATSLATIVITTWSSGSWKTVATVPASSAGRAVRVSRPATTTRPAEAAAVEVRDEPGERPQQRRLAGAGGAEAAPPPRRARARARRPRSAGGAAGYANERSTTEARATAPPPRRAAPPPASASLSRVLHGGRGARVVPARPKPRASIASARPVARSSEPATSGESSARVAARPLQPHASPPHRLGEPGGIALERRHEPRRQRHRERRPPRTSGRRDEPVVVEQERVGGEREPQRGEPQRVQRRLGELGRRHVERPEHRQRRPFPEHRPVRRRPQKRREHEHAEAAREHAEEVDAAASGRRAQADREQDGGQQGDRPDAVGQQRGGAGGGEQGGCGAGAHRTSYLRVSSGRR